VTDSPTEILAAAGVPYELFRHPGAVSFEEVLREMGFPPDQMIKTVAFRTGDESLLLASLPSPRRLAYGALARAAGVPRGRMRPADEDDLRLLGMAVGGVSPITRVPGVTAVFDTTMAEAPVAYLGSGRAGETLEVETKALIDVVSPTIAAIT
jgi:Cys-tRNA(Pro)/Cys-tRNA(Cys) deacylase